MAAGLPPSDPRLPAILAAAHEQAEAGLAAVTGEHYEGGHWLGSFATYLVTGRGTGIDPELKFELTVPPSPGTAPPPDAASLQDFARRYTEAWCSQDPQSVAAFFAETGSLQINDGEPARGRVAIADAAHGFMTDFPDLEVRMDELRIGDLGAEYHWTLTGTHSGSGRSVEISGYEQWTFDSSGLIAGSLGHFDAEEYARQVGKDDG